MPPSENNTDDFSTESSSTAKYGETTRNMFSTTITERRKFPNVIRTTSSEENSSTTISSPMSKDVTDPANESITSEDTADINRKAYIF
ncbi:hypothetical protein NPIL_566571 [Nephila pilipes]|uniref:Uncharacterized protein n=1 Tax=Nephila pilipes TaxID=299642 RepID=A0A8X6PE21_NEPPI|nr:hypothetical protein NPIL_566571 [Nephila pilipes]